MLLPETSCTESASNTLSSWLSYTQTNAPFTNTQTDAHAYTLAPVLFKKYTQFFFFTQFFQSLTRNVISKANKYTATQAPSHSLLMTLGKTKPLCLGKIPSCVLQVSFFSTCPSTITTPFPNCTTCPFYVASKSVIRQYSRSLISNTSDKGVSVVAMDLGWQFKRQRFDIIYWDHCACEEDFNLKNIF